MATVERDDASDRSGVAAALAALNAAWLERRYDDLADLLDEKIVMALPGFVGQVAGRAALVASYREFMERATVTRFQESPPSIHVWGDTAVASFRWEMEWHVDGAPEKAAGTDVFVFRRGPEGWRAVWRTMAIESEQHAS